MRNLATALIEKESITTTWAKAKETQKYTEKVISYTKLEDQQKAEQLAHGKVFRHGLILPKLFKELGPRYADRPGGYTRVLKLEHRMYDKAPAAIIELVDGKREIKLWLTARVVARLEKQGLPIDSTTQGNIDKLLKYKENGQEEFRQLVEELKELFYSTEESIELLPNEWEVDSTRKNIEFKARPAK